ncbi:hypothetical protein LTR53_002157 [Teratosphaeriaceae sp. CCFEE 6253]|nr:hypothetical protein LTR53_002157 [Teratosphaeriaceae sp. CCFEE 6253]
MSLELPVRTISISCAAGAERRARWGGKLHVELRDAVDADITWLSGADQLTRWGQSATIASGNTMTNSFCRIRGTILNRQSSGFPGLNFGRVGTVDDIKLHDELLKPRVEQFTKTRVAWLPAVPEGAKTAEGQFPF